MESAGDNDYNTKGNRSYWDIPWLLAFQPFEGCKC